MSSSKVSNKGKDRRSSVQSYNWMAMKGHEGIEEDETAHSCLHNSSVANTLTTVWKWCPVLNFFYFSFFQASPPFDKVEMISPESVREIGNVVGLISALLYTVMTALPGAISWDELEIVDNMYKGPTKSQWRRHVEDSWDDAKGKSDPMAFETTNIVIGKYGCQYHEDYVGMPMSVRLGNAFSEATMYLAICVLMSTIVIMSVTSLARLPDKDDDMVVPKLVMETWWRWSRWVLVLMVIFLFLGLITSINVLNDVYYLKFPQPWLERLCRDHGWQKINATEMTRAGAEAFLNGAQCVERDGEGNQEACVFETLAEIAVPMYINGRFVEYQSSLDASRAFKNEVTIGGTTTSFKNMDPLRTNGRSYYWMLTFVVITAGLCGYAQLFSDRAAIKVYDKRRQRMQEIDGEATVDEDEWQGKKGMRSHSAPAEHIGFGDLGE